MKLSERLDIAAKIQEDMSGKTALSTTIREAAEVVRRVECQQVEAGGCAPPVVVGHLQVNEPFENPEGLASLEQRARELPDDIRIPLDSLHADAGYLAGRVAIDGCAAPMVAEEIRKRVDNAKAAITAALANQQGVQS